MPPRGAGEVDVGAGFSAKVAATGTEAEDVGLVTQAQTEADLALISSEGNELAPWVNVAVGLGSGIEAGVTYTGSWVRVGGRWATWGKELTLSVGGGASGRFGIFTSSDDTGYDTSDLTGWGADVPIVLSYRSDPDVAMAWIGARGRFFKLSGSVRFDGVDLGHLSTDQWSGGVLMGFAVGFHPVWAAIELEADRAFISGDLDSPTRQSGEFQVWNLTPSAALLLRY